MEGLSEKYIELIKQLVEHCPDSISEYDDSVSCYYHNDKYGCTIVTDGKTVKINAYSSEEFVIKNERFAQSLQWILRDWKDQIDVNNYNAFESFVESFIPPKTEFDSLVSE